VSDLMLIFTSPDANSFKKIGEATPVKQTEIREFYTRCNAE
jgi:hypothetical protein